MGSRVLSPRDGEAGFTLIETLAALALTGLILAALANITAQWLPNWNRGLDRVQRSETVALAMQRIADDLASAQYVSGSRKQNQPLFEGSELSVMFVRTALGPNAKAGLDIVRIAETTDQGKLVTVRTQTPFTPLLPGASTSEQLHLRDPVVLLHPPFRLSFTYAGPDRVWKDKWQGEDKLPAAIRLTIRHAASGAVMPISTVVSVHAQAPAQTDGDQQGITPPDDNSASANPTSARVN